MPYIGKEPRQGQFTAYVEYATQGQTVLNYGYSTAFVAVYLNGTLLERGVDYTANDGAVITFTDPLNLNDAIEVHTADTFEIADAVPSSTGGTFAGAVDVNGNVEASSYTQNGEPFTGGAKKNVFWENNITLTESYSITASANAGTFGPITIADGISVTVPDGSVWTIV